MTSIVDQETGNLSWLKKCTKYERILCFVSMILFLTVATLVAVLVSFGLSYGVKQNNPTGSNADNLLASEKFASNVCITPGCVKAAAAILANMDENVDPCNDFYRFVCGEWLKRTVIPDDKSAVYIYFEAVDNSNSQLKTLIERNIDQTEPSFIKKTKEMYKTCMDLKSIERAGSKPLEDVLKSLGGWPVVEGWKWDKYRFDWIESLISLRKLGYNHNILLSLSVIVDYKSNKFHTIKLDQPSFGMPDRTYLINGLNDSSTYAYYKQMVRAAMLLGAPENKAEKEMLEALEFEMALANYSLPREDRRNVSKIYNKYTVQQLREMTPQVPWLKYINGILMDEVYENDTLLIAVPEFIKIFSDLMASTEKRVVANYIFWRVVHESLPLLSKEWREIDLEYKKELTGESQEKPRWKQCISRVKRNLGIALSSYYIRNFFKDETKEEVEKLVKYIHKEFLSNLEEIDWMDETTKAHAKAKANNMLFYIGYPKELLNDTAILDHYQDLSISNVSFFQNILQLKKGSTDKELSKLRKPNIRTDWKKAGKSAAVNAFYKSSDNIVEIPAGYLQIPFFNKDRPNYLNFGAIGRTIAHEIIHGFDDQGRQYDKDGNNINWWDETTDKHFRKKAQCIIDQYSNYTAENGMKLNGVNTQGENIADNGAVKESYLAYQSWIKDNGPEKLLPGLKYNQNQLFWIGAASEWCTKYRPEGLKYSILSHYHSIDEFRVIGPMSNLAEFAKDFNCLPDSPMNKKHKCEVW